MSSDANIGGFAAALALVGLLVVMSGDPPPATEPPRFPTSAYRVEGYPAAVVSRSQWEVRREDDDWRVYYRGHLHSQFPVEDGAIEMPWTDEERLSDPPAAAGE